MNRNMKIAFLFAVCAVSVVSFCGEAEAASGVFETLRQKTATFASQLRVFAYAISCFGIVMFTFLAISGKINGTGRLVKTVLGQIFCLFNLKRYAELLKGA